MINIRVLLPIALFITVFAIIPGATTSQVPCYTISNFAVPNFVNATFNSSKFMIRLNFIGPNSAGITINENASYNLTLGNQKTLFGNANYTYTSELLNVSWLPVEHTVTINFCRASNAPAQLNTPIIVATISTTASSSTSSTTSSSTVQPTIVQAVPVVTNANTTSTIPQSTHQGGSFIQNFINWLKSLF